MTETKTARSGPAAAGPLGKHFTRHKVAKGQDCWQSGCGCFCGGQQGMSAAMPAMPPMPSIAVIGAAPMAAADGAAIGAVRRLRIARTESRRGSTERSFTCGAFHNRLDMERQSAFRAFPASLRLILSPTAEVSTPGCHFFATWALIGVYGRPFPLGASARVSSASGGRCSR